MLTLALSLHPATAEPEYFTWVDAQGRIHNTPKPASGNESGGGQKSPAVSAKTTGEFSEFLPEEDFDAEQKRQREEAPPFFTWIDAEGRLRNEIVPAGDSAAVVAQEISPSDHTLLPPLRVPASVREAGCCGIYRPYFREHLIPYKSVLFSRPELSLPLATRSGDRPAWYWTVPAVLSSASAEGSLLQLRLRGSDAPMALIALDEQFLPLHFIPSLVVQHTEATWKSVAFQESLIRVPDRDVRAFILYFPEGTHSDANLQVEWRP